MRTVAVVVVALGIATGCGDEPAAVVTDISIAEIETRYHAAYCTYAVRCGLFADEATCATTKLLNNWFWRKYGVEPQTVEAARVGRVHYDPGRFETCLAEIAAQTCDIYDKDGRMLDGLCRNVLRAARHEGDDCYTSKECESLVCEGSQGAPVCSRGRCKGASVAGGDLPEGATCSVSYACAGGLYCNDVGLCAPRPLLGVGAFCSSFLECDYGLTCYIQPAGRCQPAAQLGESCAYGCRDAGAYCNIETRICEPVGLLGDDCTRGPCSQYYECDATTKTCEPWRGLGESCQQDLECGGLNTICDPATKVCVEETPIEPPVCGY